MAVNVRTMRGMGKHRTVLRSTAISALRQLGEERAELSVALVDDAEMRKLNSSFRGKDRSTDVLAFAQREGEGVLDSRLLGDVVISLPTASRQARARGTSLDQELETLLVHGILHLLGYDHERSRVEARRMFKKAREVTATLAMERANRT